MSTASGSGSGGERKAATAAAVTCVSPPDWRVLAGFPECWSVLNVLRCVRVDGSGTGVTSKVVGDVRNTSERSIGGKAVFHLRGLVPAANYIQVPASAGASLGARQRFLYVQLRPNPPRNFSMHFDVHTSSAHLVVRLSFSNLFKEKKALGRVVQVPVTLFQKRWTVFAVDLKTLVEENTAFKFVALKSMQLCASMYVRAVFMSQHLYSPSDMPRDMVLPVNGKDWMELYDWLWCPRLPLAAKPAAASAEGRSGASKRALAAPGPGREVAFHVGQASADVAEEPDESQPLLRAPIPSKHPSSEPHQQCSLEEQFSQLTLQKDSLQPDPILSLSHVIGFSGQFTGSVCWASETSSTVVYPCNNVVLLHDLASSKQRVLLGHTDEICLLCAGPQRRLLVTGQAGATPFLCIWDLVTAANLCRLPTFSHGLICVAFSCDAGRLVAVGMDSHARTQMVVWDTSQVLQQGSAKLVAKQTSEFHIHRVAFSTHAGHEHELATCGRENIRLWRIKNAHLPGHSLVLNEHARNSFTALAFEAAFSSGAAEQPRTLFVGSESGALYRIDVGSRALVAVYQLHSAAIRSVSLSEGVCVTGADDRLVRLWPLSFSEYIMEAEHEGPLSSVDISGDGLKAIAGTTCGTFGVLDLTQHSYTTCVRSHVDDVVALALSPHADEFVSASLDATIRIWDLAALEPVYEFKVEGDTATALVYHPSANELACGYQSGVLRVFDIPTMKVKVEFRQHSGPVDAIAMTLDGRRLFTAANDKTICVHDVLRNYQPVRMMGASFAATDQEGQFAVALALNRDGTLLAAPGPLSAAEVLIYDVETFRQKARIEVTGGAAAIIKFAADHTRELLVATTHNHFQRFDVASGAMKSDIHADIGDRARFTSLAISANGRFVLTGDTNCQLRVWNYASTLSPAPSQCFTAHCRPLAAMLFLKNNSVLSVGGTAVFQWTFLGCDEAPPRQAGASASRHTDGELLPAPHQQQQQQQQQHTPVSSDSAQKRRLSAMAAAHNGAANDDVAACDGDRTKPLGGADASQRHRFESAAVVYFAPEGQAALRLHSALGFSGSAPQSVAWHASSALFCYASGRLAVVEDLQTRAQRFLKHDSGDVSAVSVSPNGLLVATGECRSSGEVSPLYIWDASSLQRRHRLELHRGGVQMLAFNRSSRYLVSVGSSGAAAVWDARSGALVAQLAYDDAADRFGRCFSVCWVSRSSHQFVTASSGGLALWSLGAAVPVPAAAEAAEAEPAGSSPPQRSLECTFICSSFGAAQQFTSVVSCEQKFVLAGCSNGDIVVFNLARANARVAAWKAIDSEISSLQLVSCADGQPAVIVCGPIGAVFCWSLALKTGKLEPTRCERVALPHAPAVVAASFEPSGTVGVVGTNTGTIFHVSFEDKSATRLVNGHTSHINSVAFSPADESLMATAGEDGSLRVWRSSPASAHQILQYQVADDACRVLEFAPDSNVLAAGYQDGHVRLMDVGALTLLGACAPEKAAVSALSFVMNGTILAVGTVSGCVHLVDLDSLQVVFDVRDHMASRIDAISTCAHDSCTFLICDASSVMSVWRANQMLDRCTLDASLLRIRDISGGSGDANAFEAPASHPTFKPKALAMFGPRDDDVIVYSCASSSAPHLRVYNYRSDQDVRTLALPHVANAMHISERAALIAVGSVDCMVTIVDYDSGEYQDAAQHADCVTALAFDGSGTHVASASYGELLLHHVEVSDHGDTGSSSNRGAFQ